MRYHCALAAVSLACALPCSTGAQSTLLAPRPDSAAIPDAASLRAVETRGRALADYDRVAWHGTDAVLALKPAAGEVALYVAYATPDGWAIAFGRFTASRDTLLIAYEALARRGADSLAARAVRPARADTGQLLRAARALATARDSLGTPTRPYNLAVLPDTSGAWWVYATPAPTVWGVWPAGGDTRFRVSSDGHAVLEARRLHRAVWEFGAGGPTGEQTTRAGSHTHLLSDSVEDTDVFYVLAREPKVPEYIVSERWVFRLDPDGRVHYLGTPQAVLGR